MLVDTGIWIALFDPKDAAQRSKESIDSLETLLDTHRPVIPWPISYETMRSRFVKNRFALEGFERILRSQKTIFIDDSSYRQAALEHSLSSSLRQGRPLSLVDCLLRVLIESDEFSVNLFATFNLRDFHDVCAGKRLQIVPDGT
jgi:predicted nucleic acid-binding protein